MSTRQQKRTLVLTAIAIIFHVVGLVGIGWLQNQAIINATPWHLLLMFALLCVAMIVQEKKAAYWIAITFIIGFAVELVGVHTGVLFGNYQYTDALGPGWQGIPLLIGANWVIVLAGSITLAMRMTGNKWLVCILAAVIATAYDWVLEPVAEKLGYWHWQDDAIPLYNYLCWALVSAMIAIVWQVFRLRPNQFALHLFIIQLLFFIILRLLL